MQTNFLKHLIENVAGTPAIPIISILEGKKDVNEFLIAKKMDMTINQVRNILYKLSAEGLVAFIRKKDKRKGWYIYFWTLNPYKCLLKIESELIGEIQKLKEVLHSRETKRFYICKACNIELTEEKALEHDFTCEECAGLYELADNSQIIKDLTNKIVRKERDLGSIKKEIELLEEEAQKQKEKKQRKAALEEKVLKEKKKQERKKAREKEKTKLKKISPKKFSKKILKKVIKKTKPKKILKKRK